MRGYVSHNTKYIPDFHFVLSYELWIATLDPTWMSEWVCACWLWHISEDSEVATVYLLFCCLSFELLFFNKGSMICWYNILDGMSMKFLCWENHLCLKECFCITALNLSWLRYPSLHDVWMIWSWISLLLPPFHYFKGKVVLKLCVRIPIVEQTDGTCWRWIRALHLTKQCQG